MQEPNTAASVGVPTLLPLRAQRPLTATWPAAVTRPRPAAPETVSPSTLTTPGLRSSALVLAMVLGT